MSANKHLRRRPGDAPRDDLIDNPGIGQSKGVQAGKGDPDLLDGNSTVEGDVENDATPQGGVDPRQRVRANN
jgi:hypothetical protein